MAIKQRKATKTKTTKTETKKTKNTTTATSIDSKVEMFIRRKHAFGENLGIRVHHSC